MKFARWVFAVAAIYGILLIAPLYAMESRVGLQNPPAITHPEFFYGFIGVTLAWQAVFLLIARHPAKYRPIMLAAVLEKATYGIAVVVLFLSQRISSQVFGFGLVDLLLGVLFVVAYVVTARAVEQAA